MSGPEMSEARLESLQLVGAELAGARTPSEVVDVIVRGTAVAFGAVSTSLCLVSEDGDTFELVREIGYADEIDEAWHRFPVAAPLPAGDALRSGRPLILPSIAARDERYPMFAGVATDSLSFLVLPLIVGEETALGVLTIGFPDERVLGETEQSFFRSLAALCSQALHRAVLLEEAEAMAERQRFLAETSAELAKSLDYDETLARVAQLAVPFVADFCVAMVVPGGSTIERVAMAHVDPDAMAALNTMPSEVPSGAADGGVGVVLRTGESQWFHDVDEDLLRRTGNAEAATAILAPLGFTAAGVMPMVARGRPFGVIVVANRGKRPFSAHDVAVAEELAARAAVSVENARLFTERAAVAQTLQASLLPPRPPEVPGMEVATRFRPGEHDLAVGGDFYDLFRVGVNDWGLVIGDVCGKGAEAASLTALVRYSMRAAAVHNQRPADVLAEVNRAVLAEGPGERFCSAVFGRIELDRCGAWVTISVAGHPRPNVVRRAGRVEPRGAPGMLLGLFAEDELGLVEDRVGLGPGDSLVFCTDGITEARPAIGGELFGDHRLQAVLLDGSTTDDAGALADRVLDAAFGFADGWLADDVAVLVVRVPMDAKDDPDGRLRAALAVPPGTDLPVPGYAIGG
jgi:serine phosphatase RsbU (regulator of sigma subunit)